MLAYSEIENRFIQNRPSHLCDDSHENATWICSSDRGGNIASKVKYAYTTGAVGTALETIPYVYGDSNWKDKLTSYNGQTITYDAIGNSAA